jgi:hypothetical protein
LKNGLLLGKFLTAFAIEMGDHLGDKFAIGLDGFKFKASPQKQLLFQSPFEIAMRSFVRVERQVALPPSPSEPCLRGYQHTAPQ